MGTPAGIAYIETEDLVHCICCYGDGYPDSLGETLITHYTDLYKVMDMISLGNLSYLGDTLSSEDTCAYHRDRGEDWDEITQPSTCSSVYEFKDKYKNDYGAVYFYFYIAGNWYWWNKDDFYGFNKFSIEDWKKENLT